MEGDEIGEIMALEMLAKAGGVLSVLSIVKDIASAVKPTAEAVKEIRSQLTPEGPEDNAKFLELLLKLDGDNPINRVKMQVMHEYLTHLQNKDLRMSENFVYILALIMPEEASLQFLEELVRIREADNPVSEESHELRDQKVALLMDVHRTPIQKFLERHPELNLKEQFSKFSDDVERDLEETGLRATVDNFSEGGWDLLARRRVARRARRGKE